jgi:predicted alpha/beta superfamily hydrolase
VTAFAGRRAFHFQSAHRGDFVLQALARRAVLIPVFVFALLLSWSSATALGQQSQHTLTGEFRYHRNFHSSFLPADRDVIVYLPPGYETDQQRRYPVLYLQDGQNLFDGATSFIAGKEWRVDETAQALIRAGAIEPLIIVGVYNTKDRIDEYTPARDPKYKLGGRADQYGRLLVEELKPLIDSTYRTLKDARHTGLGGSSLGGLVTLYLGLKYPQTFGRLAVVSPSVWFADRTIVRDVLTLKTKPGLRLWLDIGTKEGQDELDAIQTTDDARLLRDALIAKGWKSSADLSYTEIEGAQHNESAWAQRVEPILKYLFPR